MNTREPKCGVISAELLSKNHNMSDVISKLGGYQNITTGIIQKGDLLTHQAFGVRQASLAEEVPEILGLTVEEVIEFFDVNVYRQIPVAKQGGLDHTYPQDFLQVVGELPQQELCCHEGGVGCLGDACPYNANQASDAEPRHFIPQNHQRRKDAPMYRGLFGYFPAALFEVAYHSQENDKRHNNGGSPDGPTWARGKSPDHLDCVLRHTAEVPEKGDPERLKVLRAVAWRALAALQEECESLGARPGVSSRF